MAINTIKARMKQLTGKYAQLNTDNMLIGELAVPTDHNPLVKVADGSVKEIPLLSDMDSYEDKVKEVDNAIINLEKKYQEELTNIKSATSADATSAKKSATAAAESATNASTSESNAKDSENNAATSAENSENSAILSKSYAVGGTDSRSGEDIDNAKYYNTQASNSASNAATSESNASTSATAAAESATNAATSESNAKNSANTATSEATNANTSANTATTKATEAATSEANAATSEANAKKYYEQAKAISESLAGALKPMGTVSFENLPSLSSASAGDMYNVSDEFVTTSEFKEGAGNVIPQGSNVYVTSDKYWDVLAGSPVTGVKGSTEDEYRRGNVDITAENVGAIAIGGDTADNIVTFESGDSTSDLDNTPPILIESGETHASLFKKITTFGKNVRWLLSKMGTTDISAVGDGTVTGAINSLNTDLAHKKVFFGNGDYLGSANGTIEGVGLLTVICINHVAQIIFDTTIKENDSTSTFLWGLSPTKIETLTGCPTLTVCQGGYWAHAFYYDYLNGYSTTFTVDDGGNYLLPARLYDYSYNVGGWAKNEFPKDTRLWGVAYCKY